MAAMFLAKRGVINIYRASPRDYNNSVRCVGRVTCSRFFTEGSEEMGESSSSESMQEARQAAMGTTTDGKAPNVSVSYAVDTAKEGMKKATDVANEESGDAAERKSEDAAEATLAGGEDGDEENVAVGESGAVRGHNQSSG